MRLALAIMVAAALLAAPAAAREPDAEVKANGNPFADGSLSFTPPQLAVQLGALVRWTNTDTIAPHTATEDSRLWELSGSYGVPGAFQGFGPGESVERVFEAGTHSYFCVVHPEEMKGVVSVPVQLTRRGRASALARWATATPAPGLAFDVQRRRGRGGWGAFTTGTRAQAKSFRLGRKGTRWQLRARLRAVEDAKRATGWSPAVSIRS